MTNYTYSYSDSYPTYQRPAPPIENTPQLTTIESILSGRRTIPAYSLVLGLCDDQLPLVIDLTETSSGSFLIAGDSGFANTTLLHSIITSALLLNTELEANIHLISPQADSLTRFHHHPNFKISYQPDRPECAIVLEEMVSLVRSRERARRVQPYHLFFIDSLDMLWDAVDAQSKVWLNWLITYGPRYGLWVFASLETEYLHPTLYRTVDSFSSRILGNIQFPNEARYLSGLNNDNLGELVPEIEFLTYTNGQSFRTWLLPSEHDC